MAETEQAPGRGEIWYARLDPVVGHEQGGARPCLVISDNRFNESRANLVVVVPLTRTDRQLAFHVRIEASEGGLTDVSFAMCEAVRSISKLRMERSWGKVGEGILAQVEDRMRLVLRL